MDDVSEAHATVCAPAYQKSVREVMGVSGIIPDEYWEGLSRLRERLGLSEEASQGIFAVEVTAKMSQFGQKAVTAMEEKAQQQQKQEQDPDATGDMNIKESGLVTEVLNLVDFAVAAKAIVTKEAAGKEFEVRRAEAPRHASTARRCRPPCTLWLKATTSRAALADACHTCPPVGQVCGASLRDEFEDVTLRQLYKQYLIEAFGGSNPSQNQRLFDNLNRLALVLGLKSDEVKIIHNEIGTRPRIDLGSVARSLLSSLRCSRPMLVLPREQARTSTATTSRRRSSRARSARRRPTSSARSRCRAARPTPVT